MPVCPDCGTQLSRVHRSRVEKLLFSNVFRCERCARRLRRAHRVIHVDVTFYLSTYTRCIRCATPDVRRSARLDRVDSISRHPLSVVQRLFGAPINRCFSCRVQYFDWRPVRTQSPRPLDASPPRTGPYAAATHVESPTTVTPKPGTTSGV